MVKCLIAQNFMMKTIIKDQIVFAGPGDFDKRCVEPLNSLSKSLGIDFFVFHRGENQVILKCRACYGLKDYAQFCIEGGGEVRCTS
jgi:hypothetical protein